MGQASTSDLWYPFQYLYVDMTFHRVITVFCVSAFGTYKERSSPMGPVTLNLCRKATRTQTFPVQCGSYKSFASFVYLLWSPEMRGIEKDSITCRKRGIIFHGLGIEIF